MKALLHNFAALMILLVSSISLSSGASAATPVFPTLSGRVVDDAGLLPPQARADLTSKLETLEAKTSRQLVIVTVASVQGLEIEDYGYQLGRAWGIGEQKRDTGVLLIVAKSERRVRVEVGYGLESILTDGLSNAILQQKVLPQFRAGDFSGGIAAGADALIEQLSLPDADAKAQAKAAASAPKTQQLPIARLVIGFLIIWVVFGLIGTIGGRQGHRADLWLLPLLLLAGSGGHGGRGGMGGGFSGGGGSFGGGGASGRW